MMTVEYKDYYKILGVRRDADPKTIKQAYRRLARKHHPDVAKARDSAERFKEINEAYEVLSDPAKRERYDSLGPDWQRFAQSRAGGPFEGFTIRFGGQDADLEGFSDFFRTIFGDLGVRRGAAPFADLEAELRGRRRPRAGREDSEARVEITLEEAYHGTRKTFSVDGRRIEVAIPPGVDTGSRVRVPGVAGGDLYLHVSVAPHPRFERKGNDLHVELPVSVSEAALGAEVHVPTLKGSVSMKVPPETSSGKVFRLPGYGMPRLGGGGAGDQYVKIRVVLPTGLTPREKALFEELARLRPRTPRAHPGA
jgi:DnaJ-class molecular chaperone